MPLENRDIMTFARSRLTGNWGVSVATFLVYLVITLGLGAIPVIGWIAGFIISGPLLVGLHGFSLAVARGSEAKVEQLFEGFNFFANGLVAYILALVFTCLWTLLLIVPGIMAALSYSMTFFILADNKELSGLEAIRRSKAMMYGHRWRFSWLLGRFTGWLLLGIITCGIGFLWIGPYIMVSVAKFYEDIRAPDQTARQSLSEIAPA
jgi:uncharacterized membrane protein